MKCYSVPFTKIDQDEDFKLLAEETDGHLDENNTIINWSCGIARGQVKKWHLDAGLHLRVWDIIFSERVELTKVSSPLYVANSGYSFLCILTPDSVVLKSVNQHQQISTTRERMMVVTPESVNVDLQVIPNRPVRLVDFQIAPYWLRTYPGYIELTKYFEDRADGGLPVLIEPCVNKCNMLTGKIFENGIAGNACMAALGVLSGTLISHFLEKLTHTKTEKGPGNISLHYDKVMKAEEILIACLHTTLPRLGKVAQQVALSESTLKRYFKLFFGKSIYEYYLNKKMDAAWKMLMEKPLTVNEAAELMGYEKVSNFIEIFKKHHGYSPGAIRKKINGLQDTGSSENLIARLVK